MVDDVPGVADVVVVMVGAGEEAILVSAAGTGRTRPGLRGRVEVVAPMTAAVTAAGGTRNAERVAAGDPGAVWRMLPVGDAESMAAARPFGLLGDDTATGVTTDGTGEKGCNGDAGAVKAEREKEGSPGDVVVGPPTVSKTWRT